ncbi:MAG TPA: ATP-binding protein [bacterium]|nr:ATP-binding protein [bacterium]HQG45660.1 ATP-binding protein [bacterium]HQI49468.1 ATP-binding protein [bacterium]HQJ63803.1 ATP-binding protein [bacterium]
MNQFAALIRKHQPELVERAMEALLISPWSSSHTLEIEATRQLFSSLLNHLILDIRQSKARQPGLHLTDYALQLYQKNPHLRQDLHSQLLILGITRLVVNHFLILNDEAQQDPHFPARFESLQRLYDHTLINLSHFWGEEYQQLHQRDQTLIRELKIVKDGLQRQLNLTYQLLQQSPLGVIAINSDLLVQHWNPMAAKLTGYEPPDILDRNVMTLFTTTSRQMLAKKFASPRGYHANLEVYIQRKQGSIFPALLSLGRIAEGQQPRFRYVINFQDISERAAFQSSVQRLNQLSALSRLSSAIMHDIRNPLNSIGLNTELIEQVLESRREGYEARIADLVQATKRQLLQLRSNLDHYLTYTHLSHLKVEPFDLGQELALLVQETRLEAAFQSVALHYRCTEAACPVMGDWIQLRRVFVNLITNAMEATGAGGKIRVRLIRRGRRLSISIADNGPGIEPEIERSLFTPFFTTKKSGAGLGLFICREIVLAHHGRISVTTQGGKGTRFTVSLPLHIHTEKEPA